MDFVLYYLAISMKRGAERHDKGKAMLLYRAGLWRRRNEGGYYKINDFTEV